MHLDHFHVRNVVSDSLGRIGFDLLDADLLIINRQSLFDDFLLTFRPRLWQLDYGLNLCVLGRIRLFDPSYTSLRLSSLRLSQLTELRIHVA